MKVIEMFCQGRRDNPDLCEDVIFVGENFVAVMDGVSDKSGLDYGGMTGGRWAALTVCDELARLPGDATLAEAEMQISSRLERGHHKLHPGGQNVVPAASTLLCYSRLRREVWRIGDGHYAIDGLAHHGSLAIDEIVLAARWAYVEGLRQAGYTDDQIANDEGQAEMRLSIQSIQHHFANSPVAHPLAYGVLNGVPVPSHLREVFSLDDTVQEVILSSDGYPLLLGTLAETETYLAADLADDPLRIGRHRGFAALQMGMVSYDDRSYVRLAV